MIVIIRKDQNSMMLNTHLQNLLWDMYESGFKKGVIINE